MFPVATLRRYRPDDSSGSDLSWCVVASQREVASRRPAVECTSTRSVSGQSAAHPLATFTVQPTTTRLLCPGNARGTRVVEESRPTQLNCRMLVTVGCEPRSTRDTGLSNDSFVRRPTNAPATNQHRPANLYAVCTFLLQYSLSRGVLVALGLRHECKVATQHN